MRKKLVIIVMVILLQLIGIGGSYRFGLLPIVSDKEVIEVKSETQTHKEGDKFNVFEQYDFANGNYSLYLVLSNEEATELDCSKVLFTSDIDILVRVKNAFTVTYTGGDIATCESYIYLLKNDDIIAKMGIALTETTGLQSGTFGWLDFAHEHKVFYCIKSMKRVYKPYVKI
jgi:hypothetical protein